MTPTNVEEDEQESMVKEFIDEVREGFTEMVKTFGSYQEITTTFTIDQEEYTLTFKKKNNGRITKAAY